MCAKSLKLHFGAQFEIEIKKIGVKFPTTIRCEFLWLIIDDYSWQTISGEKFLFIPFEWMLDPQVRLRDLWEIKFCKSNYQR